MADPSPPPAENPPPAAPVDGAAAAVVAPTPSPQWMVIAEKALSQWKRVENAAVIAVFVLMALLSVSEVVSRLDGPAHPVWQVILWPFAKLGLLHIQGAQVFVQHLTMWAGFLGALLATREHKHLGLSTAELLPEKIRPIAHLFGGVLAAFITAMLAVASFNLVLALRGSGSSLGNDIPEWASVSIMPITLSVMALRQALACSPKWGARIPVVIMVLFIYAWRLVLPLDLDTLDEHVNDGGLRGAAIHGLQWLTAKGPSLQWPGSILILIGLLLGTPVYAAMSGAAMLWFFAADTPIASVPTETYRLVASPTLPAIPILTGAGFILAVGGSSRRLVHLFRALVGWLPGGMALMVIAVCAIFTTLTGGSGVTILALGGIVYPILREEKYPENFSLGVVTAAGSLGLLFFPSVPVILYAVVSEQPIEKLFVAGFIPGVLMIVFVAAYAIVVGIQNKVPRHPFSFPETLKALRGSKWDMGAPLLVLVSFASGWATMVEAAALVFIYSIIMEVWLEKTLTFRQGLPRALSEGGTLVGSVLMVLGMAMGLTSYLVDEGIPALVINWVKSNIQSPILFLLILNALLLVLGSVLEIFSAIVILAPLLAPLGAAYGIDALHLGIIFLANLELGFLFPPVGLNLFLSSTRFQKPLPQLYKAAFPFLIIMTLSVLVITYVPSMSTGVFRWWSAPAANANAPAPSEPGGDTPAPDPAPAAAADPAPDASAAQPSAEGSSSGGEKPASAPAPAASGAGSSGG